MKKLLTFLIAFLIFVNSSKSVIALNDPLLIPNNKFGIHILNENDLQDAANLINSSGGDWGYVTVVITEAERDHGRWQRIFDKMRRLHLIPIVRIATKPQDGIWVSPRVEEIENWATFLNSLNWVVQNRYVVIYNEPNHAKEWGGKIDPGEYATYLKTFSQKLKDKSPDFFVLPAGIDASANNSNETMNETKFLTEMLKKEPDVFNHVDGWTSHSYANPDFSGIATERGKGTVTSYDWELAYLESLGINKDFPIFITETGWSNRNLTEEEIGKRLEYAFSNVWIDKRIVAVTPFVLNYTAPPFDVFSWKKSDQSFYSFYNVVKNLTKIKGEPIQEVRGKILGVFVNPFTLVGSSFKGVVLAQNLGQSIWISSEVGVNDNSDSFVITTEPLTDIEPQKLHLIHVSSNALNTPGAYQSRFVLRYKGKDITDEKPVEILVLEEAALKNTSIFAKILGFVRSLF